MTNNLFYYLYFILIKNVIFVKKTAQIKKLKIFKNIKG